eukprot:Nitzschia sp. Nitz4//scaffold22_size323478//219395//220603//NITZ4_000562-RA/size323478-processed-gene-0.418-mRNA-1//1//CDS//3329543100//2568//frame0
MTSETTNLYFLTPEERYEVWEVKSAERPQLLTFVQAEEESKECKNVDDYVAREERTDKDIDDEVPLPLVDGCDLPGWRSCGLVRLSLPISSVLNVGSGCSMLRRESQLPLVSTLALQRWHMLRRKFLEEPSELVSAARICKSDALQLTHSPWFERENVPVLLEGLADEWKATETCRWNELVTNYGDYYWRFSDTHGACMTLETYDKYINSLEGLTDDAPLAVYDSQLDGDERAALLEDYEVPTCFAAPDLFEALDEDERPPYRWILMGPARSGTGLHVDPMGTHAWVTVIEGLKRWVLFPYGTDKSFIGMQDPQIQSALWFDQWYDQVVPNIPGVIEVLQHPGETVYVPAGWPHLVLNLEPTVAITHNYATQFPSMERLTAAVKDEEPGLYPKWVDLTFNVP